MAENSIAHTTSKLLWVNSDRLNMRVCEIMKWGHWSLNLIGIPPL